MKKRYFLILFVFTISVKMSYAQMAWTEIKNSNFKNLTHLYFADDRVGIACQGDSLLLTKDEGASWSVKTIPNLDIKHCEIFYHNGDTLFVVGGQGHNEVYYGHGFNSTPVKLDQPTLKPRSNSYLTDVVQFGATIMVLGAFEDSATAKPVVYRSDDFGASWYDEIYYGENEFLIGIEKRGDDTLAVSFLSFTGSSKRIKYWRNEMKERLSQFFPINRNDASCRSGECFFGNKYVSPQFMYHQGANFFTSYITVTDPDIFIATDFVLYDKHELLLLRRTTAHLYSAVAYHLTPTGYDERVEYFMPDSLKPLLNIALGHKYVYINAKDVIYKSTQESIALPSVPVDEESLDFILNRPKQFIAIEGLESNQNIQYSLFSTSGKVVKQGVISIHENEIFMTGLQKGFYTLLVKQMSDNTYQTFKFVF